MKVVWELSRQVTIEHTAQRIQVALRARKLLLRPIVY